MQELDLLSQHAVAVVDVLEDGSAAAAGVREGDLIVAVQGRIVTGVDDIHRILALFPATEALALTLVRGEQKLEVAIAAA